jgi:hydrogenase maturation protease
MTGPARSCRALVGGFGKPGMRDLDFGRQVIDCLQQLDWPDGVVVEDLSCAAPLVLHRLQELRPPKVVLLGAVPRGLDPPGTLRRYRLDPTPSGADEVHRSLEESAMGLVDLDHTVAVARHWGGLPVDTVVIEVEPAESCFGLGFSEELAGCFDPIVDLVREELAEVRADAGRARDLDAEVLDGGPPVALDTFEPADAMSALLGYARDHAQARLESRRAPALVDDLSAGEAPVALATRVRPWGVCVESGGDWCDAVPLTGGNLGIVVGNVPGRGVEVAPAMSDLRAAVRAYVVLDGDTPARMVRHLDRLAEVTGLGRDARLVYLFLESATGQIRFVNAGGCPPLVFEGPAGAARFVPAGRSAPLGVAAGDDRPEASLRLDRGATVLLFTDGLVQNRSTSREDGLERLRRAATQGPAGLDDLCDHVLTVCTADLRRDDDICLFGVRLLPTAASSHGVRPGVPGPEPVGQEKISPV